MVTMELFWKENVISFVRGLAWVGMPLPDLDSLSMTEPPIGFIIDHVFLSVLAAWQSKFFMVSL
jgi:hypothetical protein